MTKVSNTERAPLSWIESRCSCATSSTSVIAEEILSSLSYTCKSIGANIYFPTLSLAAYASKVSEIRTAGIIYRGVRARLPDLVLTRVKERPWHDANTEGTSTVVGRMYVYAPVEWFALVWVLVGNTEWFFLWRGPRENRFFSTHLEINRAPISLFFSLVVNKHAESRARPRHWITSMEARFHALLRRTFVCAFITKSKNSRRNCCTRHQILKSLPTYIIFYSYKINNQSI